MILGFIVAIPSLAKNKFLTYINHLFTQSGGKLRFDEDNNIQWAKQLEQAGVHVVYGVIGLKTHTKIALIIRKEKNRLRTYFHIGTGNYGPLIKALEWNTGIYFFYAGISSDIKEGINKAKEVINSGFALKQLEKLIHLV